MASRQSSSLDDSPDEKHSDQLKDNAKRSLFGRKKGEVKDYKPAEKPKPKGPKPVSFFSLFRYALSLAVLFTAEMSICTLDSPLNMILS